MTGVTLPRAADTAVPARTAAPRDRWWLVVAVGLGVFMGALDVSVVNVALPAIEHAYGTRTSVTEWVVLGYLLPLVALGLPSGRWLDRVGRRPALVFAVAGFAAASAVAGLAPTIGWLVAARVVQGAFAAVLFALTPVLATVAVRPERRGRAMGIVTTLGPLGAVSGPVLGGLLAGGPGWRWIFYLNVPVSVAVVAVGAAQLPAGAPLRLPDRAWLAEAALLGGAAASLLLALSLGASHGPGWLALAAVGVALVAAWRRTAASAPVRELARAPGMASSHAALLASMFAMGAILLLLPFYLQRTLGASPGETGLVMLASPLTTALLGPVAGALADRHGARRVAAAGAAVLAVGIALLAPLGGAWTPGEVAWRLAVVGAGAGLFNAPNMAGAMAAAPRPLLGTTGASLGLARQLGLALGPSGATLAWAASGYSAGGMRVALAVTAALAALAALGLAALVAPRPRA